MNTLFKLKKFFCVFGVVKATLANKAESNSPVVLESEKG